MTWRVVFEEPTVPRTSPLRASEPKVNWFVESTRPEAVKGRRLVNDLYARFPDRDGHMYQALHSPDEARLLTAFDKLLVHDLLSRQYSVTYEEGERTRPDFRLYNESGYIGAVEIASLFLRKNWSAEQRRHAQLEDELNKRLRVTTHFLDFEVQRWNDQPSPRHLAQWIEGTLQYLRANPDALPVGCVGNGCARWYKDQAVDDHAPRPSALMRILRGLSTSNWVHHATQTQNWAGPAVGGQHWRRRAHCSLGISRT